MPNFSANQALQDTQHTIDPVSIIHFLETVGTNSNDLDELYAAVHQRQILPTDYIRQKLVKAMHLLESLSANKPPLRDALRHLASFHYDNGQHSGVDAAILDGPALQEVVLYDPVKDAWQFRSRLHHTAARCCFL